MTASATVYQMKAQCLCECLCAARTTVSLCIWMNQVIFRSKRLFNLWKHVDYRRAVDSKHKFSTINQLLNIGTRSNGAKLNSIWKPPQPSSNHISSTWICSFHLPLSLCTVLPHNSHWLWQMDTSLVSKLISLSSQSIFFIQIHIFKVKINMICCRMDGIKNFNNLI